MKCDKINTFKPQTILIPFATKEELDNLTLFLKARGLKKGAWIRILILQGMKDVETSGKQLGGCHDESDASNPQNCFVPFATKEEQDNFMLFLKARGLKKGVWVRLLILQGIENTKANEKQLGICYDHS